MFQTFRAQICTTRALNIAAKVNTLHITENVFLHCLLGCVEVEPGQALISKEISTNRTRLI
jgi:hypothetical protein